jgi:hypothetical protein
VEALRAEIRLLALLLIVFSSIKILACSLAYASAVITSGGVDEHGGQTFYWLPQVLFYTLLLAGSRRMRRFDPISRTAVMSLSLLSLVATVVYVALDFTFGPASRDPAMGIAIRARLLLTGGDVWDIVFPLLTVLWLRGPEARRLFSR